MGNKALILAIVFLLGLGIWIALHPCDGACQARMQAEREAACVPQKIATAEDGTILWSISYRCYKVSHAVYFSTKGTSTAVPNGKSSYEETVPNSGGGQAQ